MSTHRDERVALALGMLPPEQAQELRARIAADPQASADLAADEAALAALLTDFDHAVFVPPHAEARLLARVQAERLQGRQAHEKQVPASRAPSRPSPSPRRSAGGGGGGGNWGLPLGVGLLAALGLTLLLRVPADLPARYAQVPGAAQRSITGPTGTLGTLTHLPDGRMFVHLTRPPGPGRTYQLWRLTDGQPESLGVFAQGGLLSAPLPPGTSLAVTLEPTGGSDAPTTQPLFVQTTEGA